MASSDERGLKRFSGDDADDAGKQLRKFRNWAEAKMVTMKDLAEKQKGPWIYTLLDGRALEAVEHLTLTDLVKEDGAATLWSLLTARFPEKESEDQMGEALGEVFALCAKDGERSNSGRLECTKSSRSASGKPRWSFHLRLRDGLL